MRRTKIAALAAKLAQDLDCRADVRADGLVVLSSNTKAPLRLRVTAPATAPVPKSS